MPTNDDLNQPGAHDPHIRDSEHPGYEVTDVNAGGVAVFLAGLFGSVFIFFLLCYGLGVLINGGIRKEDGPTTKWNRLSSFVGADAFEGSSKGKREDLASNPEMQQREFQQMTSTFPEPRLDIDDGNQATADLHAREDLLLNNYSVDPKEGGTIRIPIARAMEILAQRGLPVNAQGAAVAATEMVGDEKPTVQAPLTSGFARTGYELETIEAREQKLNYGKAAGENKAELAPVK